MPCSRLVRSVAGQFVVVGGDRAALADRQVLRRVEAEAGRVGRRRRPWSRAARPRARGRRPTITAPTGRPAAAASSGTSAGWPAMCWTTMAAGRPARRTASATVPEWAGRYPRPRRPGPAAGRPARSAATAPQKVRLGVSTAAPAGKAQRPQRDLDRRRAGRDRDHMPGAQVTRERQLELGGPRAHRDPAGTQHLQRCFLRRGNDLGLGERHRICRWRHLLSLLSRPRRARGTPTTPRIGQPDEVPRSSRAMTRVTRETGPEMTTRPTLLIVPRCLICAIG